MAQRAIHEVPQEALDGARYIFKSFPNDSVDLQMDRSMTQWLNAMSALGYDVFGGGGVQQQGRWTFLVMEKTRDEE